MEQLERCTQEKIAHIYELAMKTGVPVIGLIDCAGMRLQEATDALAGFGQIYQMKAKASGVVPQISAIFGNCGGGVAVMAAMSDFTFMEQKEAKLFVNSPNTLEGNYTDKLDTASADFQKTASTVDFVIEGEAEVLAAVRELVSILPENTILKQVPQSVWTILIVMYLILRQRQQTLRQHLQILAITTSS